MANYSFIGYAPDIISISGGTATLSASFDPNTDRRVFDVTDDAGGFTEAGQPDTGTRFDGDQFRNEQGEDTSQNGVVTNLDGSVTFESGPIYLEQQYNLTAPDGTTITLYRVEIDGPGFFGIHVGYVTSEPLVPGVVYTSTPQNVTGINAPDTTDPTAVVDVPCFTKGTFIQTPKGEVKIEDLKVGDLVTTADGTDRSIQWIGSKTVETTPDNVQRLNPIRISKGVFAPNVPSSALLVSPNHRVLISRPENEVHFGEFSVLVPAKHLMSMDGVTQDTAPQKVTYYHFLLHKHEIVISNGAETESFHPGDVAFNSLAKASQEEILYLFPELKNRAANPYGQTAARVLRKNEAKLLFIN